MKYDLEVEKIKEDVVRLRRELNQCLAELIRDLRLSDLVKEEVKINDNYSEIKEKESVERE